jgi:GNAT superfamily N-acetyltransferase
VPLSHDAPALAPLDDILARYSARGLAPAFRIPDVPAFAEASAALAQRGLHAVQPTQVLVARASDVLERAATPHASVRSAPDAAWTAIYTSQGFDAADGAHRVRLFTRAAGSLFADVRDEGGTALAAGVVALDHAWAGVHGMRTAANHRRQGLASRVLGALAAAARQRGFERMLLQVEADNESAQSVYRRHGFVTAWTYRYWRP